MKWIVLEIRNIGQVKSGSWQRHHPACLGGQFPTGLSTHAQWVKKQVEGTYLE